MCLIAVSNSWLLAGCYYEAIFSVLNKIGNFPQAFILSLQLREAEVTDVAPVLGEGRWCPLALPQPLHVQDLLVQYIPVEGRGWPWTYCHAHGGQQFTPHPSSWVRARFAWGLDTLPQDSGCTNKPSSVGQIKVSHHAECWLCRHTLFTASCAKWLFWFADVEHPDLSSKVSAKPTSFDSEKTWLLLQLKCQHMDFRTNCMHHGLIKLLPGALPE